MVLGYCNFGICNSDSNACLEEGDSVERLTYFDEVGERVTLENLEVSTITSEKVTFMKMDDLSSITMDIDDIEDWS